MSVGKRRRIGQLLAIGLLVAGGSLVVSSSEQAPSALAQALAVDAARNAGAARTVTLVTGDQVTVTGTDASNTSVRPAAGRSHITFLTSRVAGHLHVVPADALSLVRSGRLDRRLFDVTALLEYGYDDRRGDLPLIVRYTGDAAGGTQRGAAAANGARVVRQLPGKGTYAVRVARPDASTFWQRLNAGGDSRLQLAPGVSTVWLDGKRRPSLDTSAAQIGAPAAWQAGYTGSGVEVAVLDTGVDADHPDLAGRVVAAANFTEGYEDDRDLAGHGTHVASILAGSGAASGGRYRGVASGATIASGKVCARDGCSESWILAGMHWAAAERHAKVVNLSLGGPDTPGTDPVEQAVEELTAQYGTLFVVAAGNDGADGAVHSPASADAALAVGAVAGDDSLAPFSNRGPRLGDLAVKPDLTGPGVDITAARGGAAEIGTPGDRYVAISGTSMATPHVAGAAAILAQQHPDWSPGRLKATLMAGTRLVPGTGVFGQGAGRVDVSAAIRQTVIATPPSVSFGMQSWPHHDDPAVTREVTYTNSGASSVDLNLAVRATGPDGASAPAGMFTLGATRLTVPAGGTARTTVTVNSRLGNADGAFAGHLTATAGTTSVRTPVAVGRETEHHDIVLNHTGRDGAPSGRHDTLVYRIDGTEVFEPDRADSTATVRVPPGRYAVMTRILGANGDVTSLIQPRLEVRANQRVELDARLARQPKVTVPKEGAAPAMAYVDTLILGGVSGIAWGFVGTSFEGKFTAQIGPAKPVDGVVTQVGGVWAQTRDGSTFGSPYAYRLNWYLKGQVPTEFVRAVSPAHLATVHVDYGDAVSKSYGWAYPNPVPVGFTSSGGWVEPIGFRLPASRTEFYLASPDTTWSNAFDAGGPEWSIGRLGTLVGDGQYRAGETYRETWNRGVFGPSFSSGDWLASVRDGGQIIMRTAMYSDSAQRIGFSPISSGRSALYRDGVLVERHDSLSKVNYTVPPAPATYRVEVEATRGEPFDLATRTTLAWTFRSGQVSGPTPLPLSVVRFTPTLDASSAAPAGVPFSVPFTVHGQPGSTADKPASVLVEVSYDDGATWQKTPATGSAVQLRHPANARHVSLRAVVTDTAGNVAEQTIIRAYRLTSGAR